MLKVIDRMLSEWRILVKKRYDMLEVVPDKDTLHLLSESEDLRRDIAKLDGSYVSFMNGAEDYYRTRVKRSRVPIYYASIKDSSIDPSNGLGFISKCLNDIEWSLMDGTKFWVSPDADVALDSYLEGAMWWASMDGADMSDAEESTKTLDRVKVYATETLRMFVDAIHAENESEQNRLREILSELGFSTAFISGVSAEARGFEGGPINHREFGSGMNYARSYMSFRTAEFEVLLQLKK